MMAFPGWATPYDPVFLGLKKAVHQHIVSTIERFQLRLTVARVNDIVPELRFWDSESNTYNFQRWMEDEQLLVRLLFDPNGTYVEVRENVSAPWKPLDEYLDSLPRNDPNKETCRDLNSVMEYRNGCQREWWDGNDKTFDLKGLPLELREIIYGFAMEKEKVIHPYRYKKVDRRGYVPLRNAPNVALLCVSRAIFKECSPLLWSKALFCFHLRHHYIKFTKKVAEARFQQLRGLQLAFTHCEFFKFFGAKLCYGGVDEVRPLAVQLKSMSLKRLELIIPHPNQDTECYGLAHSEGFCQKTVVDLMLMIMRPYVLKHMGVLVLSGAISDIQKAMFLSGGYRPTWNADLYGPANDAVANGVKLEYDNPAVGNGLLVGEYDNVTLPPRCNCDPPCWTSENPGV